MERIAKGMQSILSVELFERRPAVSHAPRALRRSCLRDDVSGSCPYPEDEPLGLAHSANNIRPQFAPRTADDDQQALTWHHGKTYTAVDVRGTPHVPRRIAPACRPVDKATRKAHIDHQRQSLDQESDRRRLETTSKRRINLCNVRMKSASFSASRSRESPLNC